MMLAISIRLAVLIFIEVNRFQPRKTD